MSNPRILITGALGQIGRVLARRLTALHGPGSVLATDLAAEPTDFPLPYQQLDATDAESWRALCAAHEFEQIYHLVAVLSAKGEADPWRSWEINMQSWRLVLDCARSNPGCRVFFPSSIAVYGPPLPRSVDESQVLTPSSSYGISKAAGELWGKYCREHYGVDVRCLRLPGVIGYETLPGGGTTDYAVHIFHAANAGERFSCFLGPDTRLPMIYMDDLIRGIIEFMAVAPEVLAKAEMDVATGLGATFNLAGFSVTPAELYAAIAREVPGFAIEYAPDFRQHIADSWPAELDGTAASRAWGWTPKFDCEATVSAMLRGVAQTRPKRAISPTP